MMSRRTVLAGGGVALVALLASSVWRETRGDPLAGRAEHPLGFSVAVPEGFSVRRPGGKLVITEKTVDVPPRWMTVDAVKSNLIKWPRHREWFVYRETAIGLTAYRIKRGSPSGNVDRWTLRTMSRHRDLVLMIEAHSRSASPPPDFEYVWDLIDTIA